MRKKHRKLPSKSFKELVQENKQKILNDKQELERIEQRIEQRHIIKTPAS
ncbi:FbpB family small basic protein [Bacillus pseudomycoides]|nr:FbpB family small basic protein [Bacillus pseudomycoides]